MLQTATCLPCHQQGPREVPHGFSPDLGGHGQPGGLGSQAANEQSGASLLLTWSHALCELQKVKIIPCMAALGLHEW